MDEGAQAIVLKRLMPRQQKAIVLDKQRGKIDIILSNQDQSNRLCNGALVSYSLEERNNRRFIQSLNIKQVPFAWARHDILFLHHVLEIASFFLPFENVQSGVFEHLSMLYDVLPQADANNSLFKKRFLVTFFTMIGMVPDSTLEGFGDGRAVDSPEQEPLYCDPSLKNESLESLDRWLAQCIQLHPQVEAFKTLSFLTLH